jgi:hypothetical protein
MLKQFGMEKKKVNTTSFYDQLQAFEQYESSK